MIVRDAGTPSRWRSLIAIVAVLCLLSALAGSWAVRFGPAASAAPEPATASADAIIPIDNGQARLVADPRAASDIDHNGPSSTNQKSFKTAGIKRDRPPNWSRSAPPEWWLPTPSSLITSDIGRGAPHSRAPATPRDGQELLSRLCISRC